MAPSSLVGRYQRFGGINRLNLQDRSEDKKLVTTYNITQHHNTEDHNPNVHRHENIKSDIQSLSFVFSVRNFPYKNISLIYARFNIVCLSYFAFFF
jgi:hypothetical protein